MRKHNPLHSTSSIYVSVLPARCPSKKWDPVACMLRNYSPLATYTSEGKSAKAKHTLGACVEPWPPSLQSRDDCTALSILIPTYLHYTELLMSEGWRYEKTLSWPPDLESPLQNPPSAVGGHVPGSQVAWTSKAIWVLENIWIGLVILLRVGLLLYRRHHPVCSLPIALIRRFELLLNWSDYIATFWGAPRTSISWEENDALQWNGEAMNYLNSEL